MKRIDEARERLLAEGERVLFESGYEGIDVKGIANSCGMATGTFYNYFGSKQEFVLAVVSRDCVRRQAEVDEILSRVHILRDRLEGVSAALGRYRDEIDAIFWQIPLDPDETRRLAVTQRKRMAEVAERAMRPTLDALRAEGSLSDSVARHIVSFVASFFDSQVAIGGMDFEEFYSCLRMLLDGSGAAGNLDVDVPITRESLRRMGELSPGFMGIYLYRDDAVETIYYSPALPAILGIDSRCYADSANLDALDIVLEEDRQPLRDAAKRSIESGEVLDVSYRVRRKDVGFDWVHARARFCGRIDGFPVMLFSFSNASVESDIYQEILDSTDRKITVCDIHTHEILYANRVALEDFGGEEGLSEGLTCYGVLGLSAPCPDCYIKGLKPGEPLSLERHDEKTDTFEHLTGRLTNWCGHDAFVLFVEDVTELRRAERQAARHREMYEAAVEDAKLVIWEYDIANHRIIMSDNEFTRYDYTKFALPKVIEDAPAALVPFIDENSVETFLEMYRRIEAGEPKASCEVWYKLKVGQQPRCERITYTTVFDAGGHPVSAYGLGQNITASKLEEQQFNRMYATLAKGIPNSLGSYRLNLTKDLCFAGQSSYESVLHQGDSGTVDGYFEASARIISDSKARERFLRTFTRESVIASFRRGESKVSMVYPVRIPQPDGETHWIEGTLMMAQNPATSDVEGVTTGIDVTNRIYSELVMRAFSREVFGFVILLDMMSGTIIMGGDTAEDASEVYRHADYTSAMVSALEQMMPPERLEEAKAAHSIENIRQQLEHNRVLELSFITKDGRYLHWRIAYADEARTIALIMREDITDAAREERRRIRELEEERRAHQHTSALLQSILDTAPVSMFWKDVDRRFEGANRAFLDFYGFTSLDAILGKNDEDMGWHPDPGPYKDDELRVIRDGVSTKRVPGLCESHGKMCRIVASKSPRYENGKIVGLVGNFEDVTAEYEREAKITSLNVELSAALAEAERANAEEQAFLSNMSHDMRTPLNGILGFAELARGTSDIGKKENYLEKIELSGNLMLDLVNDVLDLSKIESGKLEIHVEAMNSKELFDAVVSSVSMLAKQRGIELDARLSDDYPRYVMTDRLRCQQVSLNLLSNAIKYTPDGGHVRFAISAIPASKNAKTGQTVPADSFDTLVVVSDDGIGMSKEFQKRMYEPFSQEHQSSMYGTQGTGLGLSIVRSIVELMDGTIEVESKLGKGTTFRVVLPMKAAEVTAPTSSTTNGETSDIEGMRILLCEDNDLNAEIAETILRERGGARVVRTRDGKEGLETFRASAPGDFDAILMDIRMPVMDGISATKAIRDLDREDARKIPIVAMSADAFSEDVRKCLEAGMDAHIPKPVDADRLFAALAAGKTKSL